MHTLKRPQRLEPHRFELVLRFAMALMAGLFASLAPVAAQAPAAPGSVAPSASTLAGPKAPEAASAYVLKPLARATRHMIVTAHPAATEAGLAMLRAGGSAVDAAIAAQLVLNLVEPQSSGLGGGAFLVHHDAAKRRLTTYDGRETAPGAAKPTRFLKPDGTPLPFDAVLTSGASVGVPGLAHLLETTHKAHGKLPWAKLFEPAIKLARDGFSVSPRLSKLLAGFRPDRFDESARTYFFPNDKPLVAGEILKNPLFADTLEALAKDGAQAFYRAGGIGDQIMAATNGRPGAPGHPDGLNGDLTPDDFAAYKTIERPAVCAPYRGNRVCGMGPPSSGAHTVGQILALLEPFTLGPEPMNVDALHLITEAMKLAYADRDRYIADPAVIAIPPALLDPSYIASRRALISRSAVMQKAEPGNPWAAGTRRRAGIDATVEMEGTSHLSIIDAQGNTVSMTSTIENGFGSRRMAAGFLLNNQLTDFSFRPVDALGEPIANAIGPGKRPRSSMAPTIVLDNRGRVRLVTGSPGGSRIILFVAKSIIAHIDWGLDAQAATGLPNFGSRNGPFEFESEIAGILPGLRMQQRGHIVRPEEMNSGLHTIIRRWTGPVPGALEGGADPRREGLAAGD